ncbi:MAG: caspase family protein [Kofleriaceae bacterium]
MKPGRRIVAAVGIDRYPDAGIRPLNNAVNDARAVVSLLVELGFETVAPPLYDADATYGAMWSMTTDGPLTRLDAADSLVVFYAGHGATNSTLAAGNIPVQTGYLLPASANQTQFGSWMQLDPWLKNIARLPPRHVLVILDACESGVALNPVLKWRDVKTWKKDPLDALTSRTSRRVITSALDNQLAMDGGPVHGHSLFTGCLLEALRYGVGHPERGQVSGSELGQYLRDRVTSYPGAQQTPDYGTFDFDERGELLLPILEPGGKTVLVPPEVDARSSSLGRKRALIGVSASAGAAVTAIVAYLVSSSKPSIDPDWRHGSSEIQDALVVDTLSAVPLLPSPDSAPDLATLIESVQPFTTTNGIQIQASQILRGTYRAYLRRSPAPERVTATPALDWDESRDDRPVGGLTQTQAAAFCAAIGASLPTESQWTTASPIKVLPREWSSTSKSKGAFAKVMGASPEWLPTRATPGSSASDDPAIVLEIGFRCVR